ncbi:hypothetical protein [Micromonospora sp. DT31]|uniref:hypothetical protein n=1 Tax=Micromonospora sp. DT31 TaxID=3393434 RepID=UPI003CEBC0CD
MRYVAADFDRLRESGSQSRPSSIRLGQAERYVDRLASPDGNLEPKWRDYLRRFVHLFRPKREPMATAPTGGLATSSPAMEYHGPAMSSPALNSQARGHPGAAAQPLSWTERARQYAPQMLQEARQLDQLDAALVANPQNDAFRRLFYGGRLERTKHFHEDTTRSLEKAIHKGEERVAQQAFDQPVPAGPAPAQPRTPTLPSLIAEAAKGDFERQRAAPRNGRQPDARSARRPRSRQMPPPRGRARG